MIKKNPQIFVVGVTNVPRFALKVVSSENSGGSKMVLKEV
jgi:hypothetical protein